MKFPFLPAILAVSLAAVPVLAVEPFPFVLPWDASGGGVTSLANYLDQPAGAHGFVVARDGHLYAGQKRIRFFGVNVAFGGNFPTHADAEKIAARFNQFGINCVRFHHMDTGTAPAGLLKNDRVTFDPESLDRLDYFIAQLKRFGVYTNLNLHVGNQYPGMPKWEGASNYFKGVDNFYPPMIEQQHAYARQLLTHVNPYTKLAYTDDPAVAFIEINNENGLIMEWNNGAFDAMPDPYAAEFTRQWNAWLTRTYGTQEKLAAAWKEGAQPLGAELLPAGTKWNLEQHEGASATLQANGDEIAVHVEKPGQEAWHVQFNQTGLNVEQGKSYTVSFRVRAAKAGKMTVNLGQTHAPWKVLASRDVKVTTDWQDIRFTLVASESDERARISFSGLGQQPGDFTFSQISLKPGGIEALRDGDRIGSIPFFRKGDLGTRTPSAQRDWTHFLVDTESAYWPGMSQFIKGELKARSLVLGSATGFSPWIVQSMLDVVDAHSYWQHPHFPHRPWDPADWTVKNLSMAGTPDGGALTTLATRRVAGKPFIVTEYNHASPNTYSSEGFLEVCALGALQDWDGIFAFAYCHRLNDWSPGRITSFFDIDQHPTKMATLPAALTLFYRADLTPPKEAHIVETTIENALESIRKGSSWVDARAYGIAQREMFMHPIGMRLGGGKNPGKIEGEDPVIKSANGQFIWDTAQRRMLVNTPRSVMVVGNVKAGEEIALGDVKIVPGETMQNWATITLTTIKGPSLTKATHILVTATGYAGNADMKWKDEAKTSVGQDWGKGPSVVEGIPMKITLPTAQKLRAWALDERGQRKGEVPVTTEAGKRVLSFGPEQKTLWWELSVE